ncbi:hypothetical protein BLOT_002546 [Blomia tropicalis]|nr:hypothetical protein BLOT_002546 [Blomia tropicalis]
MKSKSSTASATSALAEHHHHFGLFGSPGSGSSSASTLLAIENSGSNNINNHSPSANASYPGGGVSNAATAQQILNYAAAQLTQSKAAALLEGSGANSSANSGWDNAVALQMSQLFSGNSAAAAMVAASSNSDTLAQLNVASQLIAASLMQQQQQQQQQSKESSSEPSPPPRKLSKSSINNNNNNGIQSTTNNNNLTTLLCSICGQVSRDPSDYEAHLMTHISLFNSTSANQNPYQYGLNLLRMQSLFNGTTSANGSAVPTVTGSTNANGTSTSSSSSSSASTNTSSTSNILTKKRKLLAASHNHHQMDSEIDEKRAPDFDSLSRLGLEQLLKGSADSALGNDAGLLMAQQAQNLIHLVRRPMATLKSALNAITMSASSASATNTTNTSSSSSSSSAAAAAAAYPCTSCHKTFATEVDLKAHLIRHLTQHPFVCVNCGKGFKYEHSLNFHIKSYHSGGGNSNSNNGSNTGGGKNSNGGDRKCKDNGEKSRKMNRNQTQAQPDMDDDDMLPTSNQQAATTTTTSTSSSLLHSRLTLMDENHNALRSTSPNHFNGGQTTTTTTTTTMINTTNNTNQSLKSIDDLPFFFGKPPTNLPIDSPIQIRSEKLLVSILDAFNVVTEQPIVLYKCCLCCVAFASLEQMSIHVQNVHLPPGLVAATTADLFATTTTATTNINTANNSKESSSSSLNTTNTSATFSCDKCTAKFSGAPEYEMHMQLHRTLEAQALGLNISVSSSNTNSANSVASALYPFNLFSHLTGTNLSGSLYHGSNNNGNSNNAIQSSPVVNTVDFRQILANASNTDFGRKFAAQLLQESAKDHLLDSYSAHHNRMGKIGSFDSYNDGRCTSPISSATPANPVKSHLTNSDTNNNSLLYLSLLPDHGKTTPSGNGRSSQFGKLSADSSTNVNTSSSSTIHTSSILNLSHDHKTSSVPIVEKSTSSSASKRSSRSSDSSSGSVGKSSSSNANSNASSMRHIKEPIDIFEGAGQSLPIQKFPLGDIEETAPGQFKCRFCEKTFDRVFSVHRHERVHTGFKPCICKTCGRGFSEKRNLRHHIIRFHSDGSGRELLKRKRKPKNGQSPMSNGNGDDSSPPPSSHVDSIGGESMLLRNEAAFMSTLLNAGARAAAGGGGGGSANSMSESLFNAFRNATTPNVAAALNGNGSLSNLKISNLTLSELDQLKNHFENENHSGSAAMNLSNGQQRPTSGSSSSSSRRRKGSRPSRKVYEEEEEDDDDEVDEDEDEEKEMVVVDVDVVPLVTEEDDDDEEEEDDVEDEDEVIEDDNRLQCNNDSSKGISQQQEPLTKPIIDGDETEEDEDVKSNIPSPSADLVKSNKNESQMKSNYIKEEIDNVDNDVDNGKNIDSKTNVVTTVTAKSNKVNRRFKRKSK